jgi:hypothetical protein
MPLFRWFSIGEVLYHEIGHHIHAEHRPVHDGKENVAEDWSRKLWRQFVRSHYWYLTPVLYVLALSLKPIARRYKRKKQSSNSAS